MSPNWWTSPPQPPRLVAGSRGNEIVSSLEPGARVFGDADLLVTAVRNLIGNAINYSATGARIAVSVRCTQQLVEIAVADQGQGIPESEQARIFERFYRVDAARSRATGGTGLGLAIVKHICANHGGEITVWSEQGQGSTFTMRLPAARTSDDAAPRLAAGSTQIPSPGHQTREVAP
jgi:two-component system sensor histidine kinase SenX3